MLEFERLAALSNGHLYNLRQSQGYRLRLCQYKKTRPTAVQIGERKKPAPNGQPGFLRIDTVHQGDRPEGKGIYHINAVDEITQWEVVLATPRISEAWLMPLLESILQQFPFVILNFHSDNGSEFINKTVAELLEKLLIEQTKSRPRKSGDNGLVETKNAAIVRKHIGWVTSHSCSSSASDQLFNTSIQALTVARRHRRPAQYPSLPRNRCALVDSTAL